MAINAGILAFHRGAGVLGTPIVAVAAGGATLAIAQIAFALIRSMILRPVIAAVVALPATLAGYHVALAMAQIGVPSLVWQESSLASARFLSAARHGHVWLSSQSPAHFNRAAPLAIASNLSFQQLRARDDLVALIVV